MANLHFLTLPTCGIFNVHSSYDSIVKQRTHPPAVNSGVKLLVNFKFLPCTLYEDVSTIVLQKCNLASCLKSESVKLIYGFYCAPANECRAAILIQQWTSLWSTSVVKSASKLANTPHRLRGSASNIIPMGVGDFLTFFRCRLWGSDPSTDIHAKSLKRRVFTQGCAFCGKSRYFSYPLISRPPKRSKFCKFLDLEIFRSIWPLTLEVTERTSLILHRSSMKVT